MTLAVEASRTIDAPLSVVWKIISDLDSYHQHADTQRCHSFLAEATG